jgi:hypothetical protein
VKTERDAFREEVIKGYLHKHPNMFFFPASVVMLLTVSLRALREFFCVFFVPVREKPRQNSSRTLF